MGNTMKQLIKMSLILFLVPSLSGCFYMMKEGSGGAAERFALEPELDVKNTNRDFFDDSYIAENKRFIARIDECDRVILDHMGVGLNKLYPAVYVEIKSLLVVSQRQKVGDFDQQAETALQRAERLLMLIVHRHPEKELAVLRNCYNLRNWELCT